MADPVAIAPRTAWRSRGVTEGVRPIPEETAVSFTYNGSSYAVMMASPRDLEDFAVGFSLHEGIAVSADDITSLEIVEHGEGIELRMWLSDVRERAFGERRRFLAGPTGCGLCGLDSLAEALRPAPGVEQADWSVTASQLMKAIAALSPLQDMNRQTRAVHAAAFWEPAAGIVALREDVGRHNALDKLGGALARSRRGGRSGAVLVTSRVSIEMVQKTAVIGAPMIVAVSAPTALAVRTAEAAGITLVAIARDDGFEVFTHQGRIRDSVESNVA